MPRDLPHFSHSPNDKEWRKSIRVSEPGVLSRNEGDLSPGPPPTPIPWRIAFAARMRSAA